MGALLPLVGKAPAVANPAEKAVLGSSLETFLITSILDTICLPLGGFSGTGNNKGRAQNCKHLLLLEKLHLIWTGGSYPTLQHGEPPVAAESQAFQLFQG